MGVDRRTLQIDGYVSRHNSDQDRLDDSQWQEFVDRVALIAREHRYDSLDINIVRTS